MVERSDTELARMAADGQRAAAGELLSRHLHMLSVMARRITVPTLDPDDLLSEAIANLLAKWAEGRGPTERIEAYIIRSMRNRVADELRSPRSRVVALDLELEPARDEHGEHHRAEMYREFELVREALGRLPEDQRKVLLATVVDGRKPGDLVEEFGRPAGAIYSLSRRAKVSLRRALLQTMLVEDAPEACVQSAAELPQTITADLPEEADSAGARHVRDCERCSETWTRYLGLVGYAGVGSLLAVGCAALPPVPPAGPVPTGASPAETPGDTAGTTRGASARAIRAAVTDARRAQLGLGLAAAVTGVALVATGATSEATLMAAGVIPKPLSTLNVVATSSVDGRHGLEVDFAVDRSWTIRELRLSVPSGLRLVGPPEKWTCTGATGIVTCTTPQSSPTGGLFIFSRTAGLPDRQYRLVVQASAGPVAITATADGEFPS